MNEMSLTIIDDNTKFKGTIPVITFLEDVMYISYCAILDDLGSEGAMFEESVHNFCEALIGTFRILKEDGKLEAFLHPSGWSIATEGKQTYIVPPLKISVQDFDISKIDLSKNKYAKAQPA
jgi:hypothetical protein